MKVNPAADSLYSEPQLKAARETPTPLTREETRAELDVKGYNKAIYRTFNTYVELTPGGKNKRREKRLKRGVKYVYKRLARK